MKKIVSVLLISLTAAGCASKRGPEVITPNGLLTGSWTPQERSLNISGKKSHGTAEASYHFIRIRGAENPHIHRNHDLHVVLLSGEAKVHFKDREFEMKPGDIVEIPRGTYHWAENLSKQGSEVYAIFTPPYDGKDYEEVFPGQKPVRKK